jgi:hypothetical protein
MWLVTAVALYNNTDNFISHCINKYDSRFFPPLLEFFLILNGINKFVDLQNIVYYILLGSVLRSPFSNNFNYEIAKFR